MQWFFCVFVQGTDEMAKEGLVRDLVQTTLVRSGAGELDQRIDNLRSLNFTTCPWSASNTNVAFVSSPDFVRRSIVNAGQARLFASFFDKMNSGENLHLIVYGASVTASISYIPKSTDLAL
jgi:hypothetical protein